MSRNDGFEGSCVPESLCRIRLSFGMNQNVLSIRFFNVITSFSGSFYE